MTTRGILLVSLLLASLPSTPFAGNQHKSPPARTSNIITYDSYKPFTINNVFNYYGNNGDGSYNRLFRTNDGFEFPKGSLKTLAFEDGIIWGGFHGGTVKVGGSMYRHGLQPGPIVADGIHGSTPTPADPMDPRYRIYCVRPDVTPSTPFSDVESVLQEEAALVFRYDSVTTAQMLYDAYIKDWNEWPARATGTPTGLAPFTDRNDDGLYEPSTDVPGYPDADQTLYYVSNDADVSTAVFLVGSEPIGLEMHKTLWGYNRSDALGNAIFSSTILINKSGAPVDDMYIAQWADPDIGYAMDDLMGCDTVANLGYAYNSGDRDSVYGSIVPALGYLLLQGPIVPSSGETASFLMSHKRGFRNLPMTAFVSGIVEPTPYPQTPDRPFYNLMTGHKDHGEENIDPLTNQPTTFVFSGDPVTHQGWLDGPPGQSPGDRRLLLSTGPITMASGDTQEVVFATLAGQGTHPVSSVAALKAWAGIVSWAFHEITSCTPSNTMLPQTTELMQNYPNPFNPMTVIQYTVAGSRDQGSGTSNVKLVVYDVLGREVAVLVNERKAPGSYEVRFDGSGLASGVYMYRLESGGFVQTRKMLLIR